MTKTPVPIGLISVGLSCSYRCPNLGTVGYDYVGCKVINWETSHTGRITTVTLESRFGKRPFTTVPRNLYF